MHVDTLQHLTTRDLLPGGEVGYLQHLRVADNLGQLAPLLQQLASLELGLETADAATGLFMLQQLHSLRRLKLSSSTPRRNLRLGFAALRLLPSSLTDLNLHFEPALGDNPLANMFPTVCFPNLQRLGLRFGAVPLRLKWAEPFQATDALCPLLTWLEVVGPIPRPYYMVWNGPAPADLAEETLSAQFLTRFPATQTLIIADGHVRDFHEGIDDMPHLVAARLHLDVYRETNGSEFLWQPVFQNLQILQVSLRGFDDGHGVWYNEEALRYDLSAMPNLIWAMIIGPYVHVPADIPRSLSKLLLVSNNSNDERYELQCDLSSLDMIVLITMQDRFRVNSGGFPVPQPLLHQGDPTCNAAFPSDVKWYILKACSANLKTLLST